MWPGRPVGYAERGFGCVEARVIQKAEGRGNGCRTRLASLSMLLGTQRRAGGRFVYIVADISEIATGGSPGWSDRLLLCPTCAAWRESLWGRRRQPMGRTGSGAAGGSSIQGQRGSFHRCTCSAGHLCQAGCCREPVAVQHAGPAGETLRRGAVGGSLISLRPAPRPLPALLCHL